MTTSADREPRLSRRGLLAAAGATALAGAVALTACTPGRAPGEVVRGTLRSSAMGGLQQAWAIVYPPGTSAGAKLPVAVGLHGSSENAAAAIDALDYPRHLASAVNAGVPPFAVAIVDAGNSFYQRIGRQDGGALIADEFLPLLTDRGLDTDRLALTGWSMGGWGAFRLAAAELAGRVRAIAALSTPCFDRFDDLPAQDLMTRKEFEANNFATRPQAFRGLPVWLACGTSDAFYPGNVRFADRLERTPGVGAPTRAFGPGDHSHAYWAAHAVEQFTFLGRHL